MNNSLPRTTFDVELIRKDFPILTQYINNYPLIYFDNAATTQKPKVVIDAITDYYTLENANVHRSIHTLSTRATIKFEAVRDKIRRFINAKSIKECIFVKGATEGINLVANSFVVPRILPQEEILITTLEHHSNIVPWQMVCNKTNAELKVAQINFDGELSLEEFANNLNENTKFVAITYASNAIGTINPLKELIELAHKNGSLVLVDGAQATAHLPINVQELGCDFYVFSGHKMYGPTGVGVLWGKEELLEKMVPYQGGGEMINQVTFENTEYAPLPYKFEAGTPAISSVIGLGAAIDYLWSLDMEAIRSYEKHLLEYATLAIQSVSGFNLLGVSKYKLPIISFIHGKIHAHDIGTIMDNNGIAMRSGHHCAMPLMDFFDVAATSRISLAFYNTEKEIDVFVKNLHKVKEVLL